MKTWEVFSDDDWSDLPDLLNRLERQGWNIFSVLAADAHFVVMAWKLTQPTEEPAP